MEYSTARYSCPHKAIYLVGLSVFIKEDNLTEIGHISTYSLQVVSIHHSPSTASSIICSFCQSATSCANLTSLSCQSV